MGARNQRSTLLTDFINIFGRGPLVNTLLIELLADKRTQLIKFTRDFAKSQANQGVDSVFRALS